MTEMEQLKQNTEIELIKQKLTEINTYLDALFRDLEVARKDSRRANKLELMLLFTMISTLLVDVDILWTVAYITWFTFMCRNVFFIYPKRGEIIGEIEGVFTTLEILGMIKRDDDHGGRKKLKVKKISLFERMWQKIKRDKMEEAIA